MIFNQFKMRAQALLFILLIMAQNVVAQQTTDVLFEEVGMVSPRKSDEIATNNWSIGAETMDRGLVEYDSWKDYLGELGAKKIRLQAGWAKCEKEKGVYDFEWLDTIVDGVIAEGVEPWLQTSYGNPIYEGGGGIHLSGGIPKSEEALEAWDNWVKAMAKRYKGRVKIWEIWNEPDNGKTAVEDYAKLYIRTAEIIRGYIPDATLYALSLAGNRNYAKGFMQEMHRIGKLHLIDAVSMHGYSYNPKEVYGAYEKLYKIIRQYSNDIGLIQGELGCPSEFQNIYALKNYEWTETSQSKWVARKMMGDLGRDIPSSYFLIIDIVYTHDHERLMEKPQRNTKGLIKSDINRKFVAKKQSFTTYQSVTSIFDSTLERIPNYQYTVNSGKSISLFGYREKLFDSQAVVVWIDDQNPSNTNEKTLMTFKFPIGNFEEPVYVDLRTGKVYKIPVSNYTRNGTNYTFEKIPIYDSPILIIDKSLVSLNKNKK